ncbi:LOW QUALITY PROTEIN: polycystin-1-like protein 2 [Montipora foliosa]|uniref:LOW QUALITY PROTEIN: polycystin-1-like protein 2 n=1 Tax=Montipora foliosa TaxID=591990 RepID=UPI0035F0FF53
MASATASYVFKLIVMKDTRTSSETKTVHVVEGNPPQVSMNFVLNDRSTVLPSAVLTISAEYVGSSCDDSVEYQWTLFKQNEQSIGWTNVFNSSENSSVLEIEPKTLKDDTAYRLELILTLANGTPSASAQIFKTALLPRAGFCVVRPESGEAVYTLFELFCTDWFPVNDTFSYEVRIRGSGGINFILSHSGKRQQQFVLPQGDANRGYVYDVEVLYLRGNYFSQVFVYVCIGQVFPPNATEEQDLFILLEKKRASFEELLDSMHRLKAWQLMTAMLFTIESAEEAANSSLLNSTDLAKQKNNLRDVAMRRFQTEDLDSLPDVVLISAFWASAGRNITELGVEAKKLLLGILSNIRDRLKSVAENMKAKDERLIYLGAYNLLFGTAELFRASAETSAVTGGSETPTAEQLKTRDVLLKTNSLIKSILKIVGSRTAVSQSPKGFKVPGFDITFGRETPCRPAKKDLKSSETEGFTLPSNMKEAFRDIDSKWIEFQMMRMDFNPYRWGKRHRKIKSTIFSLEFTDKNGETIPVRGDNLQIDIKIPLYSAIGVSDNFFVKPLIMRYHTVNLDNITDSMIIEVEPINSSLPILGYVKKGERPTVKSHDRYALLPDYSFCSSGGVGDNFVANCTRSPYEIMSTADFNETGLYYIGILYVDLSNSKLNHTRKKRSCFGRRRQKRDCVEPKPPPVKENLRNRTLVYDPSTDHNYSVKVRLYSCYYFALTQGDWRKDGCKVGSETNDKVLHCRCNHLTSFGGGFVVAPSAIDLDKVFTEFARLGETGNCLVLSLVCSVFGVYFIVIIWARKADLQDQRKEGPAVHLGRSGAHDYDVTLVTAVWRNAGTTANVFMTIYGTEDVVEAVSLTKCSPPGRKMFGRGSFSNYVLNLEKSLGTVIKIEMWHDSSGKNASWFLDHVSITERSTGEKWEFFHHDWLALHIGKGATKVTLMSNDPSNHGPGFKNLFYSLSSIDLADQHLWASVVTRPPRNPFTRVQRTSCCLCFLDLAMAVNAMFYQVSGVSSDVIEIGPLKRSVREVIIGVQSALIVAPVSILIAGLFRHRKTKVMSEMYGEDANEQFLPSSTKIKKQPFLLPYAFAYVAWFLCIGIAVSSATVTVFYSLQWGKNISDQWMASVLVSFVKDVFIWQPIKILIFTMVLVLVFKTPKPRDEDVDYQGNSFSEEMKEKREYEMRKSKFFGFARESVAFTAFCVLLMIVAYGNKGYARYLMNKATRDDFTSFNKINTGEKLWIYMLGKFVEDSYAGQWYNGQWEQTSEYIGNKISMLVGMPRLRQLRIQEGSCKVVKVFESLVDKCYDFYSSSEEDTTRLYLPHWVRLSTSQLQWTNVTELCPRPWRYSSAKELNNFASWAQHHLYAGGGYVLDLGYDRPTAMRMMEGVKDKDWLDRRTRAVLLEFQVLNLNTNLMSIITYHYEVLPFGFGLTWEKIDTVKIFNFQSLSFGFYLTCQILYLLVVLVYITIILMRLYSQGCAFFKAVWNWIDLGQILSATLAVVFYVIKSKFMHDSLNELRKNPFITMSFQFAILWTEMENFALSAALFIATFKLLRFIHLNPQVQILVWTMVSAKSDIFSFCAILGIIFAAHAHFAYMAFGSSVYSFSSVLRSFASEFELTLGNTDHVGGVNGVDQILGPLFTTSFMVSLAVLLVNIVISILDISLHEVKEDEEKVQEASDMGAFITTLFFGRQTER